eukprot:PhF_6_TR41632/c0_g1_i3/m.63098
MDLFFDEIKQRESLEGEFFITHPNPQMRLMYFTEQLQKDHQELKLEIQAAEDKHRSHLYSVYRGKRLASTPLEPLRRALRRAIQTWKARRIVWSLRMEKFYHSEVMLRESAELQEFNQRCDFIFMDVSLQELTMRNFILWDWIDMW